MNEYTFVNLVSILSLLLLVTACGSNEDSNENEITTLERSWVTEAEFVVDKSLHATRTQTVVLNLESTGKGKSVIRKNSVRLLVEEDRFMSICIPDDEPHIMRLELKRSNSKSEQSRDRTVLQFMKGDDCQSLLVSAGNYVLEVYHDGRKILGESRNAFLFRPAKNMLFGSTTLNSGAPDFIAYSGPSGQFVTDNTTSPLEWLRPQTTTVGAHEVWQLKPVISNFGAKYNLVNGIGNTAKFFSWCCNNAPVYSIFSGKVVGSVGSTHELQTKFIDLGNGQFQLQLSFTDPNSSGNTFESPIWLDPNSGELRWKGNNANTPGATTFTYAYKVYISGDTLSLQQGEVALFAECNFEGPATVFQAAVANLAIYNDAAELGLGLGNNKAASIKVGPNTVAHLYTESEFEGDSEGFGSDVACFDTPIDSIPLLVGNDNVSSLKIDALDEYLVSSNGCERCVLSGIDLSNLDLSGMNFAESIFIGADLTNTDLQNTSLKDTDFSSESTLLSGADFTGAALLCTNFSSSGLTGVTFGNNSLITDHSCYLNLSNTTLDYAIFDDANWRYINLTASKMSNVPDTLSTIDDPLDLSGALLSNVNWLAGKKLDGVNLGCYALVENQTTVCPVPNGNKACSTLQGIDLVGVSLEGACLKQAAMEGAFLTASNLDGADLSGVQLKAIDEGNPATLEGAFMRNVNLSGADLTGVNANNVNFYTVAGGTADATGVIATGADFSGSYLAGADFSGSTSNLQSTTWTNTMLLGADFEQADLSTNTSGGVNSGTATKFNGAYMQGTNFLDAILDNVNFTSTYWDTLGSGGELNFLIPKQNLGFSGYWKIISLPECPLSLSYDAGNPPPMNVTNANNTCPNGGPGPCDTVWGDPVQAISLAFFQSTVPPDFPQDSSASPEDQCSNSFSDPNPVDFCWTTTNNPTLCSENLLNE